MRPCNYCVLQRIKKEAKSNNQTVIVRQSSVYVLNEGEELDTRSPDEGNKQWQCWLMEIPSSCAC